MRFRAHALQPLPAYFLSVLDLGKTVTLPASQELAQPGSPLASGGAPDTDDAIARGVSPEELAERASDVFFPQPARHYSGCYTRVHPLPELIGMDSPFTFHELEAALDKANTCSAPGPDNVTVG
ncbi:hypothetical protein IscW_ISCW008326 [Ixodes scapularis]|uniref:Uncharacterized protein n=1 Tax=Ixodes scapularis TaxID=6945 RepID=B7PRN0_IXOSC|nr:hypothetical protein IscW_ISCW008326 [Ixodes scapularis]|eukprot:XP_002400389.1 hypothetical protein IscW_ISCW008326 [Ixodes scapularis]